MFLLQNSIKLLCYFRKITLYFKVYNKTKKLAGITLPLEVRANEKIRVLKNKIRDKEGVPVDAQFLIFGRNAF